VGGAGGEVEAAEDQAFVLGVEGVPAPGRVVDHRVPLDQRAVRADAGQLVTLLLGARSIPAQLGETCVDPVHVVLFDRDLLLEDGVAQGSPCGKKGGNRIYSAEAAP
jgi:hypothetical protein